MSEFRENLVSVSSLDKEPVFVLGPPTPEPPDHKLQPARPRPQSFAQKLRSTGKTVKGKLGKLIMFDNHN